MSADRGHRRPLVISAVGTLLLLSGVGRLAWVWARQDVAAADPEASVLGVVLAAAGALVALLGWAIRRHREAALPATAEQTDEAAATLRGLVGEQWDREAQARGLGDPLPVRWRLTSPPPTDSPAGADPPPVLTGSSARIDRLAAAFRDLPRRRLVITGGPGTGKTTLAVQLLRELLARPQAGDQVPVLFSLATWDPDRQPDLQDWLAAQLDEMYPALRARSPNVAAALAARNRVLPLLDGLDEVPADRRAAILLALNRYLHGVVLTSRRVEYREAVGGAGTPLTAAATIAPLALTAQEAADHLATSPPPGGSPEWAEVLTALRTGTATNLAAVTATPLGLWLVRTVYLAGPVADRPDPAALTDGTYPTPAHLQDHLLEQLVPAAIRALPGPHRGPRATGPRPARGHDPADVHRWLTTIAEQLRDGDTPDWRWWHMAEHTFSTRSARLGERVLVGLVGGLLFGLTGGLVLGRAGALMFGPAGALAFGLLGRSFTRTPATPPDQPCPPVPHRTRTLLRTAATGLAVGAAVGLTCGLAFWQLFGWVVVVAVEFAGGLPDGLGGGAAYGLTSGMAGGLAHALRPVLDRSAPPDRARSSGPTRIGALPRSAAAGLVVVLTVAVASGRVTEFLAGLWVGLVVGTLYGLLVGLPSRRRTVLPTVLALALVFGWLGGPLVALAIVLPFLVVFATRRLVDRTTAARHDRPGDAVRRTTATLAVVAAAGPAFALVVRPDAALLFALTLALVVGSIGLARGLSIGFAVGLCVGLSAALWLSVPTGENQGALTGMRVGVELGLIYGIVFGLRVFFGRPAPAAGATSPRSSFHTDVTRGLVVDLTLLLLAVSAGVAAVLTGGGLPDVPRLAVTAGLLGWLTGALTRAWFGFTVAASQEFLHRRLPAPWRVMAVLDDCHRSGLLRTVGPVYQLRHRQLQEHLAPTRPVPEPTPTAPAARTAR